MPQENNSRHNPKEGENYLREATPAFAASAFKKR